MGSTMRQSATRVKAAVALLAFLTSVAAFGAVSAHDPLAETFAAQGEYLGSATCLDCHGKAVMGALFEKTPMGHRFTAAPQGELEKKNCESCHGPGGKHAEKPKVKGLILAFGHDNAFSHSVQNAACLQCHVKDTKRHWEQPRDILAHSMCVDCHTTMKPSALVRSAGPPTPELLAEVKKTFQGQYAGDALCLACHGASLAPYLRTKHAHLLTRETGRTDLERQGCEACHGPGKVHAYSGGGRGVGGMITFKEKDKKSIERNNAACLACHTDNRRDYWDSAEHGLHSVACTSCHALMERRSVKGMLSFKTQPETCGTCHQTRQAQIYRNAHMPLREGKMDCSSCHNPHGTQTKGMLLGDSPNDTCYTCHAEKRGPFLWEHPPVAENCMTCHDAHGSVHAKMLKLDPPRLCQQCHIETRHPTQAHVAGSRFTLGRACMQCHQLIHGSNHPAGNSYTR